MNITPTLSELRKRAKLTQNEVADKLQITQAALSHFERGVRPFQNIYHVRTLAYLYDCTMDNILSAAEESAKLNESK